MDKTLAAVLVQECGRFISGLLSTRSPKISTTEPVIPEEQEPRIQITPAKEVEKPKARSTTPKLSKPASTPVEMVIAEEPLEIEAAPMREKATDVATGCVPCALGHLGTCTGILNEGMRFAHADGIQSEEVIDRVNMCLDELNAMERVDLRPEMLVALPEWEKEIAQAALNASRQIRHGLEGFSSIDQLEQIAAKTQTTRKQIGRDWFRKKLDRMSSLDKEAVFARVKAKLEEEAETEVSTGG